VHAGRITPEHWDAVGAPHDTPVMGTENGTEFTRVMLNDEIEIDYDLSRREIVGAGEELLRKHPDVGAIVCENHNMAPYARALNARLAHSDLHGLYLRHVVSRGLAPRDFGYPALRTRRVARTIKEDSA
jgi:hypothetical protein